MAVQAQRHIRNLALIGFMGTGKTSVGHLLASILNFRFVDTDQMIEERTGRRIAEIFATEGEPAFRELERQVVRDLESEGQVVISTGGGLAVDPANMASLKLHALVVCLWATPECIWHRVGHQSHRPLLQGPNPQETIRTLLEQREPFYREADVLVNSEVRSLREVAHHVAHHFHVAQKAHPAS